MMRSRFKNPIGMAKSRSEDEPARPRKDWAFYGDIPGTRVDFREQSHGGDIQNLHNKTPPRNHYAVMGVSSDVQMIL